MTQGHSPAAAPHLVESHATVSTYIRVAVVLALVTAIEVAALYIPGVSNAVLVPVLIVLSIFKFGLVVAFFMHLRYDSRILTALFVGPLLIASAIILAVMALFAAFVLLPRP